MVFLTAALTQFSANYTEPGLSQFDSLVAVIELPEGNEFTQSCTIFFYFYKTLFL